MAETLLQKLNKIYQTVDHIEKNGWNDKQKYKFVRAADLAHAVRNAFADSGIYAEVNFKYIRGYEFTTTGGSKMQGVDVQCDIVFHDTEGDTTTYTASGIGSGSDGLDKAVFKAQTGALKYALRNAFIVPDEVDPENDDNEPEERPAPRPTKTAANGSAAVKNSTTKASPQKTESAPSTIASTSAAPGANQNSLNSIPTEEEMIELRKRYNKLSSDLADAGLKPAKGLPLSKKVLIYLLKTTGSDDPKKITRGQWAMFFDIVKTVYPSFGAEDSTKDPGLKKLIDLVNEAVENTEEKN